MKEEDENISSRQEARRKVKEAGRRSAAAAHTLMQMPEMSLRRLDLDQGLREAFLAARAIHNRGARRREERRLAGVLRRGDLNEIEEQLSSQEQAGQADARLFQQVEAWRARLIEGDTTALAEFHQTHPAQEPRTMDKMVHEARREQARGKPRGAKKALFRHIATLLKETD